MSANTQEREGPNTQPTMFRLTVIGPGVSTHVLLVKPTVTVHKIIEKILDHYGQIQFHHCFLCKRPGPFRLVVGPRIYDYKRPIGEQFKHGDVVEMKNVCGQC